MMENDSHTSAKQRKLWWKLFLIITSLIFLCIIFPAGAINTIINFDIFYVLPAGLAIAACTTASVIIIRQKKVSIFAVAILIAGLLFWAGSIMDFAYNAYTQHTSLSAQGEFLQIIDPGQVSRRLSQTALGVFVVVSTVWIKKHQTMQEKHRILIMWNNILLLGFGCLSIIIGLSWIINGFRILW